jgi:hypothetical protein
MKRDQILDALCEMPPGQFDLVVAKLVPPAVVPGPQASQASRAAEVVRFVEAQHRLEDLVTLLRPAGARGTPGPHGAKCSEEDLRKAARESGARTRLFRRALGVVAVLATLAVFVWPLLQEPPKILPTLDIMPDSKGGLVALLDGAPHVSLRCEWRAPRATSCLPRAVELANNGDMCKIDVDDDCLTRENVDVEVWAWVEERYLWRGLKSERKNARWSPPR